MRKRYGRWLREPLLHFLALGAGLFLLFSLTGKGAGDQADQIVVSAGQIERLVAIWQKTWQRPPTAEELVGLIEDHVREEVYYRQALAMGLDRDDLIIRRRLRQKLEFLSEDLAAQVEPSEEELQTFLEENASAFRIEPHVSFRHIYFSLDQRGDAAHGEARRLLASLDDAKSPIAPATLSDPLLLPYDFESLPAGEVAKLFGRDFAAQLLTLEEGTWQGPVQSGYGLHLVLVSERTEPQTPELAEVRDAVEREWREARRQETNQAFYQRLRQPYTVVVERPDWLDPDTNLTAGAQK